jgi:hypothetical protein
LSSNPSTTKYMYFPSRGRKLASINQGKIQLD